VLNANAKQAYSQLFQTLAPPPGEATTNTE
jgi:hypothetical protein